MKNDNVVYGDEARAALMRGVAKVNNAVKVTLGAAGSNGIVEAQERPGHLLTNDGITIAQAIQLADPVENIGRNILLEAISRANKQSGDGSSTTTVLTAAMLDEGQKYIGKIAPIKLKKQIEDCLPVIEQALKEQTRDIGLDGVARVASISAEDPAIGALIQEIYEKIGRDGIIQWDISKTFDDHYTIGKGITIDDARMASAYMADLDETTGLFKNEARWKNPKILIVKQRITSASEFNDFFGQLNAREIKEVVVFCDEYEPAVIPDLIKTRAVRGFKALLIKMPTIWKDQWYEDLAKATGATIIDPTAGISFKQMKHEHIGTCENIVVTKTETYLDGIQDMTAHIQALQAEGSDESKVRAARLNTNTARLYIGAHSDSALSYKRLKVEDAISSAWQALHGGVVPGGGVSLRNCVDALPNNEGASILAIALRTPEQQIAKNADMKPYMDDLDYTGLDASMGTYVDMFEAGIVDPAPVVLNACRNAISVAAAILTAEVVVTLPKTDPNQLLRNMPTL